MSEEELAARVAAGDVEPDDVADEDVQDIHVALRHIDLPKAAEAGLVTWDPEEGTVTPDGDHDISETEFRQLFDDGWDDAAAVARDRQRRATLDVLETIGDEVSLPELAAKVAAHEADAEPSSEDVDDVATALHHRHLPKLRKAGLVEYDTDTETITYLTDAASRRRIRDTPPAPPEPREDEPGQRR